MLFIATASGKFKIEHSDIPLAFSMSESGSIIYGEQAEHAPIIWLRTHEERIYIQPESKIYVVTHNDVLIDGSAWLAAGDRVGIGDASISISEEQGLLVFEIDRVSKTSVPAPAPPEDPPPVIASEAERDSPGMPESRPASSAAPQTTQAAPRRNFRRKAFFAVFILLLLGVGFVLTAAPVRIEIRPGSATTKFTGTIPPIPIAGRYLAFPGDYTIEADAPGYHQLKKRVSVEYGANYDLSLQMEKLPGLLDVTVRPKTQAKIAVDGKFVGQAPLQAYSIKPGAHEIRVSTERYLPDVSTIDIRGMGTKQKMRVDLKPAWGTLTVSSDPDEAAILLNGKKVGVTPAVLEPLQGDYQISIQKEGWKTATSTFKISAGMTMRLPPFRLEKVDGKLDVTSDPTGALVSIDNQFRGRTPVSFPLLSGKKYRLTLTKPGYGDHTQEFRIDGKTTTRIDARLEPEYGIVFIRTRPSGATLRVDDKDFASASRRLRLTTTPHRITVSKPGYAPYSTIVTPRKGISKRLDIELKKRIEIAREKARRGITTRNGLVMRLVPIENPVRFKMGASRREAGRRSNEVQYSVELTRSFMIGETEISNADFRNFRAQHNSGSAQGQDLNDPRQPVVSVSWDDAARYANWLSLKENFPPAYREENGKMVATRPMTIGYRLPTEAEWAYMARYDGGRQSLDKPLKFTWGQSMPPPAQSGNFADDSTSGKNFFSIRGYRDGYAASAPVGQFPPNKSGLYDLAGNVSEWCHDLYDTAIGTSQRLKRDPTGPKIGSFHVVRGSSWRHGRITELRLSFRDYAKTPRNDLGFRIARYVDISK